MASYHFAAQVLKRSEGHSTIKAAAYRSRSQLLDEKTGRLTAKKLSEKEGLQKAEILLPEGAPEWMADRTKLWNHVEGMEKRSDAQLAREINAALPHELTDEQRFELTRAFVRDQFVSKGMVADVCWHQPVKENGDDPRNFHVHVMLTMRQATPTGLRAVKTRAWNSHDALKEWRAEWENYTNAWLLKYGHRSRVDSRSLAAQMADAMKAGEKELAQALNRQPEIHVGPKSRAAARRGYQPQSRDQVQNLRYQPKRSQQERLYQAKRVELWQERLEREEERQRRAEANRQAWLARKSTAQHNGWRTNRWVQYRSIDHSSRAVWNFAIMQRNDRSLEKRLDLERAKLARERYKLTQWRGYAQWTAGMMNQRSFTGYRPLLPIRIEQAPRWNKRSAQHVTMLEKIIGIRQQRIAKLTSKQAELLRRSQTARQGYSPQTMAQVAALVEKRGPRLRPLQ